MAQLEKTPAGFWAWEPAGKPVRILVDLNIVDEMLTAIIDGFGSVPKRGAEIGGVLLGSKTRLAHGDGAFEVTITGWIQIPCSHKFGPSFVLSEEELAGLESTVQTNKGTVVGYFRSNTREGLSLSTDDLQYCQRFFASPDDVVLVVQPAATKASRAGFFYYEAGALIDQTPLEFNFRRSELETGDAPQRRPLGERKPAPTESVSPAPPTFEPPALPPRRSAEPRETREPLAQSAQQRKHGIQGIAGIAESVMGRDPYAGAAEPPPEPRRSDSSLQTLFGNPGVGEALGHPLLPYPAPNMAPGRLRRNWVWFPLSFVFLLLGVLLGFQAALVFTSGKSSSIDPYALSLGVERRGQDLVIRWDRANPAVRTSSKGVLEITDGRYTKRVDLDSSQLQTGSVIYRFSSSDLRFRLEVQPKDRTIIMETVDWKNQ